MKKLALLALACGAIGCHKSEFDVTPTQVSNMHGPNGSGPKGMPDLNHLPPGAVKHVTTFKKGDRLPDGSISDGDRKMVRIEMPKGSPEAAGGNQIIATDDVIKKR